MKTNTTENIQCWECGELVTEWPIEEHWCYLGAQEKKRRIKEMAYDEACDNYKDK